MRARVWVTAYHNSPDSIPQLLWNAILALAILPGMLNHTPKLPTLLLYAQAVHLMVGSGSRRWGEDFILCCTLTYGSR